MTDEELRDRYQEALSNQRQATREGCPDPETLRQVLERELPEPDRLGHLDHIMSCPDCVRDFELLRSVAIGVPRPHRGIRHHPWLAVAATVVAVVGAGWWWTSRIAESSGSDIFRGTGSGWQIAPEDGAALTLPVTFVWHGVPDAGRYTLELIDGTGMVAARMETADTTILVTAGATAWSPGDYNWWVIAHLSGGRQVRGTPLRLRLIPQ